MGKSQSFLRDSSSDRADPFGTSINHYCKWPGVVDVHAGSYSINFYDSGNWSNERDQYVGLRFQIDGEVHYGWA
ncbi:MAG TPA: hypothetical protein VKB77_10455 [Terriglobales bacterium]|nr:hypothetical protein [Terriglobales bacterium]